MKKWIIGLGAAAAAMTPVIAVVSCGSSSNTNTAAIGSQKLHLSDQQATTLGYNLLTLGKLIDGIKKGDDGHPAPVDQMIDKPDGTQDKNPAYNIVKVLDHTIDTNGLKGGWTSISLSDTWTPEIKWWATQFAFALDWAINNKNSVGADSDWDGATGQKNGAVAKQIVDSVFGDTNPQRASFVEWANKWITLRREVQGGSGAYASTEASLAKEFVQKFGEDAVKLSVKMFELWKFRWTQSWGQFEAERLIKLFSYENPDYSALLTLGVNVRNPHQTALTIAGKTENIGNLSDAPKAIPAGLYKDLPVVKQDGTLSSDAVHATFSYVDATHIDVEGGVWSGEKSANTANWPTATSKVNLVKVNLQGSTEAIYVRQDLLTAKSTTVQALEAMAADATRNALVDSLGKTVVWLNGQNIEKLWTIADMGMYYNIPATTAVAWTSADGESHTYNDDASVEGLLNKSIELLKAQIR